MGKTKLKKIAHRHYIVICMQFSMDDFTHVQYLISDVMYKNESLFQ
mgnify:CR=1 FL=1